MPDDQGFLAFSPSAFGHIYQTIKLLHYFDLITKQRRQANNINPRKSTVNTNKVLLKISSEEPQYIWSSLTSIQYVFKAHDTDNSNNQLNKLSNLINWSDANTSQNKINQRNWAQETAEITWTTISVTFCSISGTFNTFRFTSLFLHWNANKLTDASFYSITSLNTWLNRNIEKWNHIHFTDSLIKNLHEIHGWICWNTICTDRILQFDEICVLNRSIELICQSTKWQHRLSEKEDEEIWWGVNLYYIFRVLNKLFAV